MMGPQRLKVKKSCTSGVQTCKFHWSTFEHVTRLLSSDMLRLISWGRGGQDVRFGSPGGTSWKAVKDRKDPWGVQVHLRQCILHFQTSPPKRCCIGGRTLLPQWCTQLISGRAVHSGVNSAFFSMPLFCTS